MIVLKKKLLERERERHMSTKQVSLVIRRFESCQRQTIAHTIIFILVLDLVVEVLDALGHLFFVDRVIDVEIVEIGVAHVGFPVLVQLGRARYRSAISSLEKETSNLVFFFKIIILYPPPIQSLMKYLLNSHRQVNWVPIWLAPNWSDCFWFRKSIRDRCVCACYSNRQRLPSLQQFHSHRPSDSSKLDCQNDADLSPTYTRTKWLQLFCLFSLFFFFVK